MTIYSFCVNYSYLIYTLHIFHIGFCYLFDYFNFCWAFFHRTGLNYFSLFIFFFYFFFRFFFRNFF
ncbi:hypothetical protein CEE44_04605 [Candidatus Woesearchaeota archaeon B3_Woes]|nr:MAG: hypothetical protein CEE44_04605 [Candidatus Woesearchaeota archaeon B3_Woes]